jgi:hypothetical protein
MYKTELNVIRYEQKKSNWCWAASIQMVGRYKTKYVSQESIVQYVKGNLNNTGANIEEIKKVLTMLVEMVHLVIVQA